jgi:hypothetical protein
MKKALKLLAATAAIWGVTGFGVVQASPSHHGASHLRAQHPVTVVAYDTGWGPQ